MRFFKIENSSGITHIPLERIDSIHKDLVDNNIFVYWSGEYTTSITPEQYEQLCTLIYGETK